MGTNDAVTPTDSRTRLWVALGVGVAAVAAAAILIAVLSSGGSSSPSTTTARVTPPAKTVRAATLPQLQALSATLGRPIYWAGPRPETYELTTTTDGRVYVRYLPSNVPVGSPRPDFLTVGTYAVANPVAALRAAGRNHGGVVTTLPGGAVSFYSKARPTSVYLAYPNASEQIEVFDPNPAIARGLVAHGKVTPVG
jgi:hypothetical protein